jgi:site-specific DNA-methyltransferase (adenine-specific)
MAGITTGSVDVILADLPFGTTNCRWDTVIPFDALWREYERVTTDTSPIILFSAQPFTSNLIMSNPKMFRYCWYWEKEKGTGFLNAKRQPLRAIEEICVFYKKQPTYNPQMMPLEKPYRHTLPISDTDIHKDVRTIKDGNPSDRKYKVYTHTYPKNILKFPRDNANKSLIPTQKPLALVEYLVETHSNKGDVVLDNAVGSGTTLLACRNLDRKFIGIEIDEVHFDICMSRLSNSVF